MSAQDTTGWQDVYETIRALLAALPSDEVRQKALLKIETDFCIHCGRQEIAGRPCRCWDDT